ncbi:family 43 glycosylhydrolase [Pelomonas sp. Root1237]|uniref:family 43 glycosylhydrolase n=1 Tax=Pelomonas sp. Root1237 TaxID=1736434 RepID=UPI000A95EE0D
MRLARLLQHTALCCAAITCAAAPAAGLAPGANPVLRDRFTADPAPLVVGDTAYLYVGRDEAKGNDFFLMKEWLAYSSKDLRQWTAHGTIMKPTDFKWAVSDAWAAQVVQRNGRFYFYATVQHNDTQPGKAIGVAVADNPLGPFNPAPTAGVTSTPPSSSTTTASPGWPGATRCSTWPSSRPT